MNFDFWKGRAEALKEVVELFIDVEKERK